MAQTAGRVRARRATALPRWVVGLILICCAIEAALTLCDLLGLGFPLRVQGFGGMTYYISLPVRQAVTSVLGFWSPQFHALQGVYPGQPVVMFLSYGLLHAGLVHLGMNMLSLAAVARELNPLIGPRRMAVVYAVSQVAAALLFALMKPQAGPMVGASGAIFGLAGALVGHAAIVGYRRRRPLGQLARAVVILIVLNVALTVLIPSIAWEAHLGGALAGLAMGIVTGLRATPGARR